MDWWVLDDPRIGCVDPLPGAPTALEEAADGFDTTENTIDTAIEKAGKIVDQGGLEDGSEAVVAVRESLAEVVAALEKAQARYKAVGPALRAYAAVLRRSQSDADVALEDARTAWRMADELAAEIADRVRWRSWLDRDDPDYAALYEKYTAQIRDREQRRDECLGCVVGCAERVWDACVVARSAGDEAAAVVRGVIGSDGLKDTWWENWGSGFAGWLSDVCGAISAVAGVLALITFWCPALSAVFGVVATVSGAVALLADFLLAAHGESSWGDVVVGVLGVFGGGVLRLAGRSMGRSVDVFKNLTRRTVKQQTQRQNAGRALGKAQRPGWKTVLTELNPLGGSFTTIRTGWNLSRGRDLLSLKAVISQTPRGGKTSTVLHQLVTSEKLNWGDAASMVGLDLSGLFRGVFVAPLKSAPLWVARGCDGAKLYKVTHALFLGAAGIPLFNAGHDVSDVVGLVQGALEEPAPARTPVEVLSL
jgi:Sec-independent protein translocase protein TatA